jgi:hypothetical protein
MALRDPHGVGVFIDDDPRMPVHSGPVLRLNERERDGRLICPVCRRTIRVGQETVDDGVYLRHAECGLRSVPPPPPAARTVRVHVRARDWENALWRTAFESDLRRTGWRLLSLEPPSNEHPEYIYVLAAESEAEPPRQD